MPMPSAFDLFVEGLTGFLAAPRAEDHRREPRRPYRKPAAPSVPRDRSTMR